MKTVFKLFAAFLTSMFLLIPNFSLASPLKLIDSGNITLIENSVDKLRLEIDKTTGMYRISRNGKRFIGDGLVAIRVNDKMLINAMIDGSSSGDMKLNRTEVTEGTDKTGLYKSAILKWEAGGLRFNTEFRLYEQKSAVKFLQSFPDGFKSAKTTSFGDTSLNFPVFAPDESGSDMNVFAYNYQIWPQAIFGKNIKRTFDDWNDGFIATPLFVFNKSGWTGVLAPFSDFLIRFVRVIDLSARGFGHAVAVGIDGELQKLEPGRVTESILVFSDKGVVDTMNSLGATLLSESGKKPIDKYETYFLKYLGYWTDNGAFYYYRTEPGKNYATTLLELGVYMKRESIPVRHLQLDSWWYYKSKIDNGVYRWEPIKEMFPDGLEDFQNKLGMPLTFHNRYFAIDTSYKDRMAFIGNEGARIGEEKQGDARGNGPSAKDGVHPLTREVFDIWGGDVKKWGGVMYEQDWLGTQISRVNALRSDPDLAANWMKNMNDAMAERGLDIQYCMPTVLFYFESTRHQAVTNIRSSNDYHVRFNARSVNLWWEHIFTSPLIAALGSYPYKDVFITNPPDKTFDDPLKARTYLTSGDPNNKYDENSHLFEPYNRQEALLSILGAGPVGIGDRIGDINKSIVMLIADEEGVLVKPDRPIVPIERMFFKNPMAEKETLIGYTQSAISGNTWFYVFGSHVNELLVNNKMKFELSNNDLPLSGDYVLYDFFGGKALRSGKEFSISRGLRQTEFVYLVLAPVDKEGRALIGDVGKLVTASSTRIKSWKDGPNGMEIELNGPKNSPSQLLIYSEKAPVKVISLSRDGELRLKQADNYVDGWFEKEKNLYEIDLAGGDGEKVKIVF